MNSHTNALIAFRKTKISIVAPDQYIRISITANITLLLQSSYSSCSNSNPCNFVQRDEMQWLLDTCDHADLFAMC